MDKNKIAIIGSGNIGGLIESRLANANFDVMVVTLEEGRSLLIGNHIDEKLKIFDISPITDRLNFEKTLIEKTKQDLYSLKDELLKPEPKNFINGKKKQKRKYRK